MGAKRRTRAKPKAKRRGDRVPLVPIAVGVAVLLLWWFVQAYPVLSAGIAGAGLAVGVAVLVLRLRRRRAEVVLQAELDRAVESTDGMSGADFEQWTARLLRRSGCVDVEVVGGSGDAGADVVATAPDGGRVVVQCKRYSPTNKVGSEAVQRFSGTARYYHRADHPLIVTTSTFTGPARSVAAQVGITLVDRQGLAAWARSGVAPILVDSA
ncbi:restriction endonuclease [Saccharothrix lopnurensis]|uniref:Restriction endonuclease n=1 Tax=Saccharothrix lopnurensis TaxID=1670621 RepID=A0ABW1PF37_9PSEU